MQAVFVTLLSRSRDAALALCGALPTLDACEQVITHATKHAAAERARFGIDSAHAERYGRLVGPLLSADADWRAAPELLERGRGGPPVLWTCGISGDQPIVLLRIAGESGLGRVHELLRAQLYWRSQRLDVDVVLLNCATGKAADRLHASLGTMLKAQETLLRNGTDDVRAAVFALNDSEITDALRDGLAYRRTRRPRHSWRLAGKARRTNRQYRCSAGNETRTEPRA